MSTPLLTLQPTFTQLPDQIEYRQSGIVNKLLLKSNTCEYRLLCLATGTEMAEHTNPNNAVVQGLEGKGVVTLAGQDIPLEPGVLIVMPAHTPHALQATENLSFLLTLSKP